MDILRYFLILSFSVPVDSALEIVLLLQREAAGLRTLKRPCLAELQHELQRQSACAVYYLLVGTLKK